MQQYDGENEVETGVMQNDDPGTPKEAEQADDASTAGVPDLSSDAE